MNEFERRFVSNNFVEVREDTNSPGVIVGYATKTNVEYDLGWFRELVLPGAFSDVLNQDVRALFNHDSNFVLGRTTSGTLKLEEDAVGLRYEIVLPNTQIGKDLAESIKRGDVSQSSFAFMIGVQEWEMEKDKTELRKIKKISQLLDVSPVTYPANPDTSVAKRNFESYTCTNDCYAARLKLAKIIFSGV